MKKLILMLMAICLIVAVLAMPASAETVTTATAEAEMGHTLEMLQIIILASIIMWYIIDRFKPLWEEKAWGKYATIALSALFAFALSFGYNLDIMAALGVVPDVGILGTVLTALTLMGGSSAISELIKRIKV